MPPRKSTGYVKFSDKLTDSLDDISRMIDDHKVMIDAIQDIALELTSAISNLNVLTVKYARSANDILDVLLPIIKKLPLIPDRVEELLIQLEKWTQEIIDNEQSTRKTIADVLDGLKSGDVSKIQAHSGDLKKVTQSFTAMIPKSR